MSERPREMLYPCRRCGRNIRRRGECPDCDGPPPVGEPYIPSLSLDDVPLEDEDDDKPYVLEGSDEPLCPSCHKPLSEGAVVCVQCGYDQRKRKKIAKVYEPLARSWETNYSFQHRLTVFLILQGVSLAAGLLSCLLGGAEVLPFLGSWLFFGVLTAFLMGTYDRLDLTRDRRGRASATSTRRIAFIATNPRPIELHGYEGLVTGREVEATFWEWLILFLLLPGIIPAGVWWYFTIHKITFYVALARDHGYAADYLYRGWREEQMRDILGAVRDAAGLRYLG